MLLNTAEKRLKKIVLSVTCVHLTTCTLEIVFFFKYTF